MGEWLILVVYVTVDDISVIYVMAYIYMRRQLKMFDKQSGSHARHLVGFFNVPAQASTRGNPFYSYSEKADPLYHTVRFSLQAKDNP